MATGTKSSRRGSLPHLRASPVLTHAPPLDFGETPLGMAGMTWVEKGVCPGFGATPGTPRAA